MVNSKIVMGISWLVGAYWFRESPWGRTIFSFLGGAVTFIYMMALMGAQAQEVIKAYSPVAVGDAVISFAVGVSGVLMGALAERMTVENDFLYWSVQLSSAGLVAFSPFFRR